MLKKIITVLLCISVFPATAQSKFAIGLKGGRSVLVPETISVTNQLTSFNARGAGGVNMLLFGRYHFRPNWSIRIGGGFIGYSSTLDFEGLKNRNTRFKGVQPQLMSSIDYHLNFGESNFGLIFSAGLNAIRTHQMNDQNVTSEEGFPLSGYTKRLENGTIEDNQVYGHDINYIYAKNKTSLHLMPEMSIFKLIGRHKLLASFIFGYALGEPIEQVDFNRISYKGEDYSSRHRFSGSFTTVQLAYEFSF